MADLFSVKI